MKQRTGILTFATLWLAALLAGCGTPPKPAAPPEAAASSRPPAVLAVRLCSLTNLVAEQLAQPMASNAFGAFFVRVGPEAPFLQGMFDHRSPRVDFGTNNMVFKRGVVHDQVTGKPGMLLFVKEPNLAQDGQTATADAWYYVSPTEGGGVRYHLIPDHTGWKIESRRKITDF